MKEKLLQLVSEALGEPAGGHTSLDGLDSLEFVELLREIEIAFQVRIEAQEVVGLNTSDDIFRLVAAKSPVEVPEMAKHGFPA